MLRWTSVWQLGWAVGDGRAINLGEVRELARRALDIAAERRRTDTLLADGGWFGSTALLGSRVSLQRGHVPSGRSHNSRAQPGVNRPACRARICFTTPSARRARCRSVPRGTFLHAFRQLPDLRCARRPREPQAISRVSRSATTFHS